MSRILIFGATGTVGHGTLLECLDHREVTQVVCVLRRSTGLSHPKLSEIIHEDFTDFSSLNIKFQNFDGCLWAIGIPQTGLTERQYTEVTYTFAVTFAQRLRKHSPECCFVFISGAGADEAGTSKSLWARVKGRTENAILALGFKRVLIFRPGTIAAKRGIKHNVSAYGFSSIFAPLMRPFGLATSTTEIGRAFIAAVLRNDPTQLDHTIYNSTEINNLAKLTDSSSVRWCSYNK